MKKYLTLSFLLISVFAFGQIDCPQVCEGDPLPEICAYTTPPPGVVITWSNGATGNCFTPTDTDPDDYTYTATVTDPAGICTPKEATVNLEICPNPELSCNIIVGSTPTATCDITVCEGEPFIRLQPVGEIAGSDFDWDSSSGEGSVGNNEMNFNINNITQSTVVTLVVTAPGDCGCTQELTFTITVEPAPILDCTDVTSSCGTPGNGTVMATTTISGGTWTISPNIGTSDGNGGFGDLPPNDPGDPTDVYTITYVSPAGCETTCDFTIEGSDIPDPNPTCISQ